MKKWQKHYLKCCCHYSTIPSSCSMFHTSVEPIGITAYASWLTGSVGTKISIAVHIVDWLCLSIWNLRDSFKPLRRRSGSLSRLFCLAPVSWMYSSGLENPSTGEPGTTLCIVSCIMVCVGLQTADKRLPGQGQLYQKGQAISGWSVSYQVHPPTTSYCH